MFHRNDRNDNIISILETKVLSLNLIYVVTLVSSEEFRLLLPIFHRMLASLQVVSFSLIDIFLRAPDSSVGARVSKSANERSVITPDTKTLKIQINSFLRTFISIPENSIKFPQKFLNQFPFWNSIIVLKFYRILEILSYFQNSIKFLKFHWFTKFYQFSKFLLNTYQLPILNKFYWISKFLWNSVLNSKIPFKLQKLF